MTLHMTGKLYKAIPGNYLTVASGKDKAWLVQPKEETRLGEAGYCIMREKGGFGSLTDSVETNV